MVHRDIRAVQCLEKVAFPITESIPSQKCKAVRNNAVPQQKSHKYALCPSHQTQERGTTKWQWMSCIFPDVLAAWLSHHIFLSVAAQVIIPLRVCRLVQVSFPCLLANAAWLFIQIQFYHIRQIRHWASSGYKAVDFCPPFQMLVSWFHSIICSATFQGSHRCTRLATCILRRTAIQIQMLHQAFKKHNVSNQDYWGPHVSFTDLKFERKGQPAKRMLLACA